MNRDFKSLQNQLDILRALELQSMWEAKSDNPELKELGDCLVRIAFYINSLELEQYSYNRVVSELVRDKDRAILRARKSESVNETINDTLKVKEAFKAKIKRNEKPKF